MNAQGKITVAMLATDGVERVELVEPRAALVAAGIDVALVSDHAAVETFDHLDRAESEIADAQLGDVSADAFDALVLPGGVANPDALRRDPAAVAFVKAFFTADKPVAAICHAPWLLIEADAVRGRSVTSWPSLKTDLTNAGASWSDAPVVRDGNLITSRNPGDLPDFSAALIALLTQASRQSAQDEALDESFPASDPPAYSGPALSASRAGLT